MPHRSGRSARFPAAVVGVVLLTAGAAGCSDGRSGGTASPGTSGANRVAAAAWPAPVPKTGLAQGLVLPLEAYMETYPETVTIGTAIDKLTERCMARYGFSLTLPPRGTLPPPNYDDSNMARRYGITEPDKAAKFGYTLGDEGEDGTGGPQLMLTDAARTVLTGRTGSAPSAPKAPSYQGKALPDGGCKAEAARKVGADRVDPTLASRLDAASLDKSQADAGVQQVVTAWSACMKSRGYTIDTPLNAPRLAPYVHGRPVGPKAIQVATADIACKKQTGLVKTWFGVESAIQRQQVEQNQLALQEQRDTVTAAVKAATSVTG
ncbi:hypothetical protein V2S66_15945 [Streptomyces sp. V4-01]|uniref:PknH-like extracellular domain-containing protein n=1 Tax=Actinacidiphila polyblastidii TaxID=3110430 RepID=A0ABU7PCC1_9ACTN|nr:hypothetical protein [Streptomyces sp. V4-01]